MDRNPVRSFSDAYRTPRAPSSHSSDQPRTPNHQLQGAPFVATPSSTMSEPKSEKLRQMLRERREGITDQSDVTQSAPQVASIGLDDYIFESEEDDDHQRLRRSRLTRAMRSASIQQRGSTPSKAPNDLRMGSKDVQADMDKLRKENWDFKLRLCLMEEKSRKLQEGLAHAEDSLAVVPKLEEKNDALKDENAKLHNEIEDLKTASNQYKRNLRKANEVNGKLLAEIDQRETAVKDANEALREALDMILDLEKKVKPLEEELARCKSSVYHSGSQDSTYFSNELDNASIAMSDDPSRPPTSHVTAHATDERLPFHRSRTRSSSEFTSPITRHINRLSRTISADADRLNVLRKKVSVRDDTSGNMFFDGSPERPPPSRPRQPMRIVSNPTVSNMTGPRRGSSASLASGFVRSRRPSNQMIEPQPGSSASLASGFNSMRRPSNQTVRRMSDTPQASRTSVASDSSKGRGLRCLYLKGEAMETSQKLQTVVAPAVQEVKSPNTETANFLHALSTSSTEFNARTSSRATTGLSSWEVFQTSDYEAEVESIAGPESVGSEEANEDLTATMTVKRSSMDTELIEPLTPKLMETEEPTVPTEYRPGQYPNWPGTDKPHWVRGRDLCFNDDGVLEDPRG